MKVICCLYNLDHPQPDGKGSVEYRTLQSCHHELMLVMKSSIPILTSKLFGKTLISNCTMERMQQHSSPDSEKAVVLLGNVLDVVEVKHDRYKDFIDALEGPHFNDIRKILESKYGKVRQFKMVQILSLIDF